MYILLEKDFIIMSSSDAASASQNSIIIKN